MTTAGPDPSRNVRLERGVVVIVLLVLAASVWWRAPAYLGGDEPLGADSSSHILASQTIAEHLVDGAPGWWAPDLNLGFPLAHYYQPVPHVATALAALALGGPERATLAYKLLVLALLALIPFTAYVGLRRLDLARGAALFGSIALATISTYQESFGLTARHFLFVGLYTMLFGTVVVPLALAEGVRFVQGRGRATLAVGAFALLFLCHGLLALGLIPVYALVALLVPHPEGVALRGRLARLVGLGALAGVLISGWLLPQLTCAEYFNGWPIHTGDKTVNGIGLAALARDWWTGEMLDVKRLPVLTVLSALGILVVLVRVRRDPLARTLLAGLSLFVVFTAGRHTFGSLLDLVFPPNSRIEGMARWIAMLDLFVIACAGLGGDVLVRGLRRLPFLAGRGALALALVATPVLALALPRHEKLLGMGLATFPGQQERAAFGRVAEALAAEPIPGRAYTRENLGHGSHWAMVYLGLLARKPMTVSYGVGGQDSLSFYYLWFLDLLDAARAPALARLFDIRYLLTRPGQDLGPLERTVIARAGPYEVSRLSGDYGLFEWTSEPRVLEARTPAEARPACKRWMLQEFPAGASFLRLAEPMTPKFPRLPSSNFASDEVAGAPSRPDAALPVRGQTLQETARPARFQARVRLDDERAWLVLKVTAHPFWTATIDREPADLYYLSPSFMGLPVERGEHEIEFTFRAPWWQKALLTLAPLVFAALVWREWRGIRNRVHPSTPRPSAVIS